MTSKLLNTHGKQPAQDAGFAVPMVLIVISACLILVLAILLNTQNERRSELAVHNLEKARANARFALDEALSLLQQEAGPDQRITANASILDADPSTAMVDGVAQPQWTGVWDAWPTWLNATDAVTGQTIADTYTPGREKRFRRWLVSGTDTVALKKIAAPKTGTMLLDDKTSILLVGKGSAGATDLSPDDPASAQQVRAGLIELPRSTGQKFTSGAYAWWVGDEGVKARINLPATDPAQPVAEPALLSLNAATERRAGLGFSTNLTTAEASAPQGRRWLTNAMLSATPGGPTADSVKPFFHHLTTWSAGVLADVRTGGLKKDLSLLLEQDRLPAPYFGISPNTTIPVRSYTDLPASLYATNLSSWYSLQQHYQLYRIDPSWSVPAAPTSLDGQYQPYLQSYATTQADPDGGVFWLGNKPAIDYYLYDFVNSQGCYRHWSFAKLEMVVQMQREPSGAATSKYKLVYNPVYTLWNPYNVTLRVPPLSFVTGALPIRYRSYKDSVMANDWTDLPNVGFTVYLRNSYGSPDRTWIQLAPGESRVFSAPSLRAESGANIELYPGYEPNGGGWVGYLFGGVAIPDAVQVELAVKIDPARIATGDQDQFAVRSTPHEYGPNSWFSPWHISYNAGGREVQIVPDQPGQRAAFPSRSTTSRIPLLNFRAVLKSGQRLDGTAADYPDYRARNFIHANPTTSRACVNSSADKYLASAEYEFVGVRLRGSLDRNLPQVAPDNRHSYIGSGNDAAEGQTSWTALEIPTTPPISLGQLQHIKLEPGTRRGDANSRAPGDPQPASHIWDVAANQAYGMANSFAHPLIPGDKIYQLHDLNRRPAVRQYDRLADTWDHGLLNNDALFDTWFFSGIAPQNTGSFAAKRSMDQVLSDFVDQGKSLPHPRFSLWSKELDGKTMSVRLLSSGKPLADGFTKSAAHLLNLGQFNVNSTSIEAWTALLAGLRARAVAWLPPSGIQRRATTAGNVVAVSRFTLPNSDQEPTSAYDAAAWAGVRLLTEAQIRRLAREMVREVKERGPFLNLSDFINRRLSTNESGVCGALQAAIDWDEKHGRTPNPSDPESINGRFKGSADLIATSNISAFGYENPKAATGSRWAGIPGYVIQGDLLTPLAPVLAPRSDTFRIRAYGESRMTVTGRVESRAWCEAIVQRTPEFMDTTDLPEKTLTSTVALNQKLGRRFKIIHFRWLTSEEL